jgi:hypothetical protein
MNQKLRDAIKKIIKEKLANSPAPAPAPSKPERETIPGTSPSEKPRRTIKTDDPYKVPKERPAKASLVDENEMDMVKKIVNRFKSIR